MGKRFSFGVEISVFLFIIVQRGCFVVITSNTTLLVVNEEQNPLFNE
jgi:hypothetical protein